MHIVDDYYLQGCLSKFKCRDFWRENAPQDMYKYDYIVALIMHGFSWAFMVHLPVLLYSYLITNNNILFGSILILVPLNALIHSLIDDLKANKKIINLIVDQSIHIFQILIVWTMICLNGGA